MKEEKHTDGFKVPETYFEDFEAGLWCKMEEKTLPNETGFKMPEAYFETMETSVFEKLNVSAKKGKLIPLFSKKAWVYGTSVAACVAVLFYLFGPIGTKPNGFESLQFSTVTDYVEGENLGLDMLEVESLLNENEMGNLHFDDVLVSDAALEDYLLENIDVTMLSNK